MKEIILLFLLATNYSCIKLKTMELRENTQEENPICSDFINVLRDPNKGNVFYEHNGCRYNSLNDLHYSLGKKKEVTVFFLFKITPEEESKILSEIKKFDFKIKNIKHTTSSFPIE